MNCPSCGLYNHSSATYCEHCGSILEPPRRSWVDVAAGVILIVIFAPVGLCGVLLAAFSLSAGPDGFQTLLFGIGMAVVAGLCLYGAAKLLVKK